MLPVLEGMMAGATPRWPDVLAMAAAAENVGLDSVWVIDHLVFPPSEASEAPIGVWEGWSILAPLAATTRRIELGTFVVCSGFRNPALLAKMAATVDDISNGRLTLGLGAGNNEFEHQAFGYPFDHRVSRFEEALAIIHPLLRMGRVDFAGRYYQARNCELRLSGPRLNGPPIVVGNKWCARDGVGGSVCRWVECTVGPHQEQCSRCSPAPANGGCGVPGGRARSSESKKI
jgi:alkanesulfonate monooxygenase SsuD/methylene tetrahydromethanopterin reductase-like flavin-dependent oxidoreductase (luciferase family)